jgi:hypothetical protein
MILKYIWIHQAQGWIRWRDFCTRILIWKREIINLSRWAMLRKVTAFVISLEENGILRNGVLPSGDANIIARTNMHSCVTNHYLLDV